MSCLVTYPFRNCISINLSKQKNELFFSVKENISSATKISPPIYIMPSSTRSLHSLSVQNPKFQLHPLFWTSYHTSIANCVFQQFEDDDPTAPTSFVSDPFSDTADDAKKLATDVGPREKFVWVESMFRRPGSPIIHI
ncbi:uncharacterized protein B0J16DRAFT_343094 [Fusarium flagelliforme]|uniref:uncharacterized protein n=1 Tax=Fusarium flagelliforme TaxID=2675880 RepID=UPI001E8CD014|nr:uncharacterized protein B0J16DRAFT_343094 [Fusarium flagelliforme]KAH7186003.1 hypothetical protein B0J16DRAFT_343094 [Fusarium flagelliforme]